MIPARRPLIAAIVIARETQAKLGCGTLVGDRCGPDAMLRAHRLAGV